MALCYLRMLPSLEARQSLRRITELVAADSMLKPARRRSIISALEEQARNPYAPKPKAVLPPTKEEWERGLLGMGVAVIHVAKRSEESVSE
jgi:hypothetical protein